MLTSPKVILVRHLATEYNENGVYMGRVIDAGIKRDEDVLGAFRDRLKNIAEKLDDVSDSIILSSPLKRCRETAEIVGGTLRIRGKVKVRADLIETDMGAFSQKNALQLRAEFGSLVDEWMYRPEAFRFPGGESYKEVRKRVRKVIRDLKKHLRVGHTVWVCTHVDIIKMILSEVLSFSFNQRRYIKIPNGSICILDMESEDKLRVEGINIYP